MRKERKRDIILNEIKQKRDQISAEFGVLDFDVCKAKLSERSQSFRNRLLAAKNDEEKAKILDEILPEAFALVEFALIGVASVQNAKNVRWLRDAQFLTGIAMHQGKIAELPTGEGKTYAIALPAYLHALTGEGVHVMTVDHALAERDYEQMKPVFEMLGISVGLNKARDSIENKQKAYAADITYGTNNAFGFDFLSDNVRTNSEMVVQQRGHAFAILDEVDRILLDDAATPMVLSMGKSSKQEDPEADMYRAIDKFVADLIQLDVSSKQFIHFGYDKERDFYYLTAEGWQQVENAFAIDPLDQDEQTEIMSKINTAIKAHLTMKKGVHYKVNNGKIEIIDQSTGRVLEGRAFRYGLQQALEAKEGLQITTQSNVSASTTIVDYLDMYKHVTGTTGTAKTSESVFLNSYGFEVEKIEPHKESQRDDVGLMICDTREEKYEAMIDQVRKGLKAGQPILIATTSDRDSEEISEELSKAQIKHNLLNAETTKEEEDIIVAQAGMPKTVTVATNMAGRGTDIKLGGDRAVIKSQSAKETEQKKHKKKLIQQKNQVNAAGGLFVIAMGDYRSNREINQLFGRAGRQGQNGITMQLTSREDLKELFGEEVLHDLDKAKRQPSWLAKTEQEIIEHARKGLESQSAYARNQNAKLDSIKNRLQNEFYSVRATILEREDLSSIKDDVFAFAKCGIDYAVNSVDFRRGKPDIASLKEMLEQNLLTQDFTIGENGISAIELICNEAKNCKSKEELHGLIEGVVLGHIEECFKDLQKHSSSKSEKGVVNDIKKAMLAVLDESWKEFLTFAEETRQTISISAYGQDPFVAYQNRINQRYSQMFTECTSPLISNLHEACENRKQAQAKGVSLLSSALLVKLKQCKVSNTPTSGKGEKGD